MSESRAVSEFGGAAVLGPHEPTPNMAEAASGIADEVLEADRPLIAELCRATSALRPDEVWRLSREPA